VRTDGPPDPEDVEVTGGGYRRPWVLYAVVAVLVAALLGGAVVTWGGAGQQAQPAPPTTTAPDPRPSTADDRASASGDSQLQCQVEVPGVVLPGAAKGDGALVRTCQQALTGPHAWLLRADPSSGEGGAADVVVVFPVPPEERKVNAGQERRFGIEGSWHDDDRLVWQLGGQYAKATGRVGLDRLEAIRRGTRVDEHGQFHLQVPDGMSTILRDTWYDPPVQRMSFYRAADLGAADAFGDRPFVFVVARGLRMQETLQEAPPDRVRTVHGRRAVFSSGQPFPWESLLWEVEPGVVATVTCPPRGPDEPSSAEQRAILLRLARHAEVVTPERWERRVSVRDPVDVGG
jgi:hypothetical protein